MDLLNRFDPSQDRGERLALQLADDLDASRLDPARLVQMADSARRGRDRRALTTLARRLADGAPLADAIGRCTAIPPAYRAAFRHQNPSLVRAMVESTSEFRVIANELRRHVVRVAIMLAVILVALLVVVEVGIAPMVARYASLPADPSELWHLGATLLPWAVGPIGLPLVALLFVVGLRAPLAIPAVGRIAIDPARAGACRVISAGARAGLPLHDSVALAAENCPDRGLRRALRRAAQRLRSGIEPAAALSRSGLAGTYGRSWRLLERGAAITAVSSGLARVFATHTEVARLKVPSRARRIYVAIAGPLVLWALLIVWLGHLGFHQWLNVSL